MSNSLNRLGPFQCKLVIFDSLKEMQLFKTLRVSFKFGG